MKITAIDTFTLRIPTQKPIALDLPEHRLVVTRIHTDAGTDGLGYALVFGGAGSESAEAYPRRLVVEVDDQGEVDGASRQARLLQALDRVWYGEPTLAPAAAGGVQAARAVRIPVATGGNIYTRFEFRDLIERGAARYLMLAVCR